MCILVKKKPFSNIDLKSIVCKTKENRTEKHWKITYSTDKENRLTEYIFAEDYTKAYIAFTFAHGVNHEIVELEEVEK